MPHVPTDCQRLPNPILPREHRTLLTILPLPITPTTLSPSAPLLRRPPYCHPLKVKHTSATSKAVEEHEPLESLALLGHLADPVDHVVHKLLAHRVMATSVVVGCILLSGDELLRVEQLPVAAGSHLICRAYRG